MSLPVFPAGSAAAVWLGVYYVAAVGFVGSLVLLALFASDEVWRIRQRQNGLMRIFSLASIRLKFALAVCFAVAWLAARAQLAGNELAGPLAMLTLVVVLVGVDLDRLYQRWLIARYESRRDRRWTDGMAADMLSKEQPARDPRDTLS